MSYPQIVVLVAILLGGGAAIVWLVISMRQRKALMSDDAGLLEHCMRMLVDTEKPDAPYSDRDLARMLTGEFGMPIRKRDVIRLRRAMNIPGPEQRARERKS